MDGYYILLVFSVTTSVQIVFHSTAVAAAGMRRQKDNSASEHHLIKHTLHRAMIIEDDLYETPKSH